MICMTPLMKNKRVFEDPITIMNTTTAFKKLAEDGYVINESLMWSRADIEEALEEAGYDVFERAAISDLDKDILLNDFFDNKEHYLIEVIKDLMINHFTYMKDNKIPINPSQQSF